MKNHSNNNNETQTYENNRRKELQEFDDTKLGVKGLVDTGITRIPPIFNHPPEKVFDYNCAVSDDVHNLIPVVDLAAPHQEVVERIREASAKFGFFQVVNHGVDVAFLDRLTHSIKDFHELPPEKRTCYYDRNWIAAGKAVSYLSNHDLFYSKAASWRDVLQIYLGPVPIDPNQIPDVCRDEVIKWDKEAKQLADRLMQILSEGLGLSPDRLMGMPYLGRVAVAANYYPYCPEPEKTVGLSSHTDPGILTILLQDEVGGLQVKHQGKWINLKPIYGALVVNIGDLFQIISNDEYKSGEHRVFANPLHKPRVSVAVFFSPGIKENIYGPLPELVSHEKPALYRQFKFTELLARFFTTELEGKDMVSYFRL